MATFVPQERMPVRPATASPRSRESLVDLLRDCVETAGARSALVDGLASGAKPDRRGCPGRWAWTWAELAAEALAAVARSGEAAAALQGELAAVRASGSEALWRGELGELGRALEREGSYGS